MIPSQDKKKITTNNTLQKQSKSTIKYLMRCKNIILKFYVWNLRGDIFDFIYKIFIYKKKTKQNKSREKIPETMQIFCGLVKCLYINCSREGTFFVVVVVGV